MSLGDRPEVDEYKERERSYHAVSVVNSHVVDPELRRGEGSEHGKARDHEGRGHEQRHEFGKQMELSGRPVHSVKGFRRCMRSV